MKKSSGRGVMDIMEIFHGGKRLIPRIIAFQASMLLIVLFISIAPSIVMGANSAKETTAQVVEKAVGDAIETRQTTQKDLEKWENEKYELLATYEALLQENKQLKVLNEALDQELTHRREAVALLKKRQIENEKMANEMLPFLERIYGALSDFVLTDIPFLKDERATRLARLDEVMGDLQLPMTEKFRKVMEALFVEAEYGNTIEVTRSKINLSEGEKEILVDIFRLGRISLFALTLDHTHAAYYHVSKQKWLPLDPQYVPTILGAIEMAGKQRTADILSMPLGKIVVQ